MFKLVALILLTSVASITCTESPYDPVKARPMPEYIGVGSCALRDDTAASVTAGNVGEISFYLRLHGLTDTEPPKHLVCLVQRTKEIFGCANFVIVEKVRVVPGLVEIRHLGIDSPVLCATALGPAIATEGFELPVGTYTLRFRNGGLVDEYEMIADGNTVTINQPHSGSYTTYDPPECCGDSVSVP